MPEFDVPLPAELTEGEKLAAQVQALEVTAETLPVAVDATAALDKAYKEAEAARDALVRPLNDHVRFINSTFKPKTDALQAAVKALKAKIRDFHVAQEKAEQEAARNAAQFLGHSQEVQEIVGSRTQREVARTERATASTADRWNYEIVDKHAMAAGVAANKLPLSFVEPAKGEIRKSMNQMAKDGILQDGQVVHGIRYFKEKDVRLS